MASVYRSLGARRSYREIARFPRRRLVGFGVAAVSQTWRLSRPHGSPFYTTQIPDLNNLQYSRYMDATATHRLRSPEDVARYAALVTGIDPMEFGEHKILKPEQRRINFRYADEVLYAIGVYLMSLDPPRNPNAAPAGLISRGSKIFARETCINCHAPPNYTSGKLTLAEGYTPPPDHPYQSDVVNISVGTTRGWR